jgi:hypothetical protein
MFDAERAYTVAMHGAQPCERRGVAVEHCDECTIGWDFADPRIFPGAVMCCLTYLKLQILRRPIFGPHLPKGHKLDFSHHLLLFALCLQFYNVGTIWFCQRMAYPLFGKVGEAEYVTFHKFYLSRIPLPVILPGFLCMFTPLAVLIWLPASIPVWMAWANVVCGVVTLYITVGLEIPRHGRLEKGGKNDQTIAELIAYNWPRTLSISGSAILTIAMVLQAFTAA